MTTISLRVAPVEHAPRALDATVAIAGRTLRRYLRTPQVLAIGAAQTVLFLVIFRYVFGGAISTGSVAYVDYLIPGFIAANVLFICSNTITAVAEDSASGFTDRLRSLPAPRRAILAGRSLADLAYLALMLAITAAAGLTVGWRPSGRASELALAFALCLAYGFAFGWLFQLLGLLAANAQAAQGLGMIVFPFAFLSSAYVPVDTMPGWMQAFARNQPLTSMIDSVRALCLGEHAPDALHDSVASNIARSLGWTAAIVVVVAPLTIARFNRRRS